MTSTCCSGELPLNLEDLDAMEDDALGLIALTLPDSAKNMMALAGKAEMLLRQRLEERNAIKLDTEHVSGTLAGAGYTHTIEDPEGLYRALCNLADYEEMNRWYAAPPKPPKRWDQRGLSELLKRGGAIRETILWYRVSVPNPPRLVLKVKA